MSVSFFANKHFHLFKSTFPQRLTSQLHCRSFSTTNSSQPSVVIALGGNAMKKPHEKGTYEEMLSNVESASQDIMKLAIDHNYKLAITHGNGPQIGSIYLQNQLSTDTTPAMPLSICGAMTQGYIGYMLQQSIQNIITSTQSTQSSSHASNTSNIKGCISCVTQVKVDANDKAWSEPSKPVGKFYNEDEAKDLSNRLGYFMMEDSGRGWRYAVASPKPLGIIEINGIKELFNNNYVVIACGGGGTPVVEINDENDNSTSGTGQNSGGLDNAMYRHKTRLSGRDAVIDKDLTAVVMAKELGCSMLMIATDIDGVYLNYLDENKREKLDKVTVSELEGYIKEGHFGKGSMGPKVQAAVEYVKETGNECVIGALSDIEQCVLGQAGTCVIAG